MLFTVYLNTDLSLMANLHAGESNADHKVGHPIDQHRNGHGTGPGTLREQFRRYHPRYGARADSEEDHKAKGGHHREVGHPVDHFLHITKKLLYKMHSTRILDDL